MVYAFLVALVPDVAFRPAWLSEVVLAPSRTVLYNCGNMSSATVLFVLEELLRKRSPQPSDVGVMCSFGARFSAFAGLLEFL